MNIIDSFDKEFEFLSNFYEFPVKYKGVMYNSSEAAFQHAKLVDMATDEQRSFIAQLRPGLRDKISMFVTDNDPDPLKTIFSLAEPYLAKKLGRVIPIKPTWEKDKYTVMEEIVRNKFTQNSELGQMLLDTGDAMLIEGNYWHDNTWGICSCSDCLNKVGSNKTNNNLGMILMKVRDELRNKS